MGIDKDTEILFELAEEFSSLPDKTSVEAQQLRSKLDELFQMAEKSRQSIFESKNRGLIPLVSEGIALLSEGKKDECQRLLAGKKNK